MTQELKTSLEETIANHKVLLFIKGTRHFPRCGFSAAVIDVFEQLGAPFETVDVLADPSIKPALASISNWPTTPQIFLGGQFVGGGDLVRELHARGELKPLVDAALAS
ncbi:MAG TPA: glutaredoxin family protein [Planctomycetota bacterium]